MNFTAAGELTVTVAEGANPFNAQGTAFVNPVFSKKVPAPWNGKYTVGLLDVSVVDPIFVAPTYTDGAGKGTITVSKTGIMSVRLVGTDRSKITSSSAGTQSSEYSIYARPYGKKLPGGYFAGWTTVAPLDSLATAQFLPAQTELYWVRPAGGSGDFSGGFGPLSIEIDYTPPAP